VGIESDWQDHQFCYVTTTGRVTGRPHEIEIWFVYADGSIYLMAGGGRRADWVKNMLADPQVTVRIGSQELTATARVVEGGDEEDRARRLITGRYQGWREGQEMSEWGKTALVVALDI
jgi:deazaflavin-dependent oxidoreductase (nitroreductase family)